MGHSRNFYVLQTEYGLIITFKLNTINLDNGCYLCRRQFVSPISVCSYYLIISHFIHTFPMYLFLLALMHPFSTKFYVLISNYFMTWLFTWFGRNIKVVALLVGDVV